MNVYKDKIEYKGEKFHNLARLADYYGLDVYYIADRLSRGWDLEKAIEVPQVEKAGSMKEVRFNGIKFNSEKELAVYYNIPETVMYSQISNGATLEDIVNGNPDKLIRLSNHRVRYRNREYESEKELADAFGVSYQTYKSRMRKGFSVSACLTSSGKRLCKARGKELRYNGRMYPNLDELLKDVENPTCKSTILNKLQEGVALEKAVVKDKFSERHYSVKYNNKEYSSVSQLAKSSSVSKTRVSSLVAKGYLISDIVKLITCNTSAPVYSIKYKGSVYSNYKCIADLECIKCIELVCRLSYGVPLEEAISQCSKVTGAKRKRRLVYKGVLYLSISDIAKAFNIPVSTVSSRLRAGYTVEEAIIGRRGVVKNEKGEDC